MTRIFDFRHTSAVPRRTAVFFIRIMEAARSWYFRGVEMASTIRCRRRPGHKPCPGRIRILLTGDDEPIRWRCGTCDDRGEIHSWSRLRHDLDEAGQHLEGDWIEVRIPETMYRRALEGGDLHLWHDVKRMLRAAQSTGEEILLSGPRDAMEALYRFLRRKAARARTMDSHMLHMADARLVAYALGRRE